MTPAMDISLDVSCGVLQRAGIPELSLNLLPLSGILQVDRHCPVLVQDHCPYVRSLSRRLSLHLDIVAR